MGSKTNQHDVLVGVLCPFSTGVPAVLQALHYCASFLTFKKVSACYGIREGGKLHAYCCVARAQTDRHASEVMDEVKLVESRLNFKLEVILLSFESLVRMDPMLTLPFPDLVQRDPVLLAASEIWGDYRHPVLKQTLNELKIEVEDRSELEFVLSGREVLSKVQ